MDTALLQQNPHWNSDKYTNLIDREVMHDLYKLIPIQEILVLLGIRRSGKSTIFKLIINELLKTVDGKSILYINLDDPFFTEVQSDSKKLYEVIQNAEKLSGQKVEYLFLDEIQNVRAWQKFVKSTYDSNVFKKIFVTGSNSSLLAGRYATLLTGRYLKKQIHPLSFSEILSMEKIASPLDLQNNKVKVLKIVEDLMRYGSYPQIIQQPDADIKRDLLISYYEAIIYKDCVLTHTIRDVKLFEELTYYLITNASHEYNYASLSEILNCSDITIKQFIYILSQAFLLEECRNFSYSLKKQSRAKRKTYAADNGFILAVAFQFSKNSGLLFENLVYTELKKAFAGDIYFYNENNECDFIIKNPQKELVAIQVCYQLTATNKQREVKGLESAIEKLGCKAGYIITFDQEEKIAPNMEAIPFWKYFSDF